MLGGSFDPPHMGHVLLANYVLSCAGIDRLVVLPSHTHPFGKRFAASFAERVAMCRLAFATLKKIEVSTLEARLPAPNYTLYSLRALKERHPDWQLRLVVGSDVYAQRSRWLHFDALCELAPLLVVGRGQRPRAAPLPLAIPELSSTMLRRRLAQSKEVRGWLPREVAEYIEEKSLYRSSKRRSPST